VLCWGEMCLVVRAVNGARRDVVVVRRLRQVGPRARRVLTRFGCVRLACEYGSTKAEWLLLGRFLLPACVAWSTWSVTGRTW